MPSPLQRILAVARTYRKSLYLATLFSILNKTLDLAPPLLIGLAVDTVVVGETSILASTFGVSDSLS